MGSEMELEVVLESELELDLELELELSRGRRAKHGEKESKRHHGSTQQQKTHPRTH